MKSLFAVVVLFGVIVFLVYQTGYFSAIDEKPAQKADLPSPAADKKPVPPVEPPAPPALPPRVASAEEPKPEPRIIYVPVEKVYVKEVTREVIRIERVVYRDTPTVRQNDENRYQPVVYHAATENDRCSSFTGEARTNCYRYARSAGNRCDGYQNTPCYYQCLKHYGG